MLLRPTIFEYSENDEFKEEEMGQFESQCASVLAQFKNANILIGLCFEKSAKLGILMKR